MRTVAFKLNDNNSRDISHLTDELMTAYTRMLVISGWISRSPWISDPCN